jgi:hypothetical protein
MIKRISTILKLLVFDQLLNALHPLKRILRVPMSIARDRARAHVYCQYRNGPKNLNHDRCMEYECYFRPAATLTGRFRASASMRQLKTHNKSTEITYKTI